MKPGSVAKGQDLFDYLVVVKDALDDLAILSGYPAKAMSLVILKIPLHVRMLAYFNFFVA